MILARIWLSCCSLFIQARLPCLPRLCRARLGLLLGLVLLLVSGLSACNDDSTDPDNVFSDAQRRVEETLLPVLTDESEVVLRYLLNILAALPEICATPLAELGSFSSSLPALQNAQQQVGDTPTLDEDDGSWEVTWRDVVLGDDAAPLTVDTGTPSVNLTLTMRFRARNLVTLRAVPFTLAPPPAVQTVADPPACATVTNEGFFLVQDAVTGEWILSWCALGETRVFEGQITAQGQPISRLIRRRSADAQSVVTSLTINDATTSVRFSESTSPLDDKGIRFFVRPGERVRFRLRTGATASSLDEITSEQIRLGPLQPPPADLDPDDFSLVSNVPIDPRGDPLVTPGTDLGTFIWQDVENNQCTPGQEDQWRLRFSTRANATVFSGTVNALDDDNNDARLRATRVGACPAEAVQGAGEFDYTCTVQDDTPSGYDICVTTGRRVGFIPQVDDVRDPGRVFLGAQRVAPPSPDPFTILFNIELEERQSSRDVRFGEDTDEDTDEGEVVLRGNKDEDEVEDAIPLNPDQISLDPLCRLANGTVQPLVRFTGRGEYSTDRFEGSRYVLDDDDDDVEFTTANVDSLADSRRFPDRGKILLRTRLDNEDAEITVQMTDIRASGGRVIVPIDVELNVDDVMFRFPDQEVDLTVE